jgi:hypothetical protein
MEHGDKRGAWRMEHGDEHCRGDSTGNEVTYRGRDTAAGRAKSEVSQRSLAQWQMLPEYQG